MSDSEAALPSCVLYKQNDAWSLPSSSAASIQVEAYMRFTGVPFQLQACATNSKSPTGQLPAMEKDTHVAGLEDGATSPASTQASGSSSSKGVLGEYQAARTCIQFAKAQVKDIDQSLTIAQKSELLAYSVLIETRLEVATVVSSWLEPIGTAEMRKVMSQLPFPLGYIIPWSQAREVKQRFGHLAREQVYSDACNALMALADRLRGSGGPFFFGKQPSSLDALLAGHLIYYKLSPAVAPVLQQKVASLAVLSDYVDLVMREYFEAPVMPRGGNGASAEAEDAWGSPSWSDAAKGQKAKESKSEPTTAERLFKRNSRLWLLGAGAAVAAYVLLSGQYIKLDMLQQAFSSDGEDDEEEDDGGNE